MDLEEFLHLAISLATISFAFAVVFFPKDPFSVENFSAIFLTVGLAFVLHEMGHRRAARNYGAYSVYRAWTLGLVVAVVTSVFLGFVFAAPGAVYIFGPHLSREQNAKISLSGPMVNLFLALAFIVFGLAFPAYGKTAQLGAYVNSFIGAFNLLPFGPMDGVKVLRWSKLVWAIVFILLFATSFIVSSWVV